MEGKVYPAIDRVLKILWSRHRASVDCDVDVKKKENDENIHISIHYENLIKKSLTRSSLESNRNKSFCIDVSVDQDHKNRPSSKVFHLISELMSSTSLSSKLRCEKIIKKMDEIDHSLPLNQSSSSSKIRYHMIKRGCEILSSYYYSSHHIQCRSLLKWQRYRLNRIRYRQVFQMALIRIEKIQFQDFIVNLYGISRKEYTIKIKYILQTYGKDRLAKLYNNFRRKKYTLLCWLK